jgi:XisH protein
MIWRNKWGLKALVVKNLKNTMKDATHEIVKLALEKEGWQITHDPFSIVLPEEQQQTVMQIDLGAEKLIAAEKGNEKIAVEIKTFMADSLISAFHTTLGQLLDYQIGLEFIEPERILYLAIPDFAYESFFQSIIPKTAIERYKIKLLIYNITSKEIVLWKP